MQSINKRTAHNLINSKDYQLFEFFSEKLEQVLQLTIHSGVPGWSRVTVWGGRSSRHQVQWADCSPHFPFPCAGVEIWLIFPQDQSVLSVTVTGDLQNKLSPHLCLNPWACPHYFPPCTADERTKKRQGEGLAKVNTPQLPER